MSIKFFSSLKPFFRTWWMPLFVIVPTLLILIFIDIQNTSIGLLPLHSIDEYIFHGSLRHMYYSGIVEHKLSSLFGYGFYQYGFIYFFINLVSVIPAFIFNKTAAAIFLPRLVTSLFAIGSLVVIYVFSRKHLSTLTSSLFVIFFVSMPAFWYNATWFHPDWAMTFFVLCMVLFLGRDNWKFGKNYYIAVLFYSLAIAFKYQALTVLPLFIMYVFYNQISKLDFKDAKNNVFIFVRSLLLIGVVFLFSNPFVVHPMGWKVFKSSFFENMKSNAINHGIDHTVTLHEKISIAIGNYYFHWFVLIFLSVGSLWLLLYMFKNRNIFSLIACNYIINLSYLFIFVNKDWQTYYLPVIFLGSLVGVNFLQKINQKKQIFILVSLLIFQLFMYSDKYYGYVSSGRDVNAPDYNTYTSQQNTELNSVIVNTFKEEHLRDGYILITPYTPFDYEKVGISYEKVRTIFGPLDESSINIQKYIEGQRSFWGDLKTDEELSKSFKRIDYIILRKDIPFIDTTKITRSNDKNGYLQAVNVVNRLNNGSLGYSIIKEDNLVVIYKRK